MEPTKEQIDDALSQFNTSVTLGDGKICVEHGFIDPKDDRFGDNASYLKLSPLREKLNIGDKIEDTSKIMSGPNSWIVFKNIESLELVIKSLNKLREGMLIANNKIKKEV